MPCPQDDTVFHPCPFETAVAAVQQKIMVAVGVQLLGAAQANFAAGDVLHAAVVGLQAQFAAFGYAQHLPVLGDLVAVQ